MNNQFASGLAGTGVAVKLAANLAVFIFLVWSMYFVGDADFGLVRGVIAFFLLSFFTGFVGMIPFGTTFAPIIFEWWWHDVPFWEFSTAAWSVTGFSMLANVIALMGLLATQKESL
jgi:hypothetical protein